MSIFAYLSLLTASLLLCSLPLAVAERAQESATEAISLTARAAGYGHARKAGHHLSHKSLTLEDSRNRAVDVQANDVVQKEDLTGGITNRISQVGAEINKALSASAARAEEESQKYAADVMELHENLEKFGNDAEQLQGSLQSEHKQRVESIDKAIVKNMKLPEGSAQASLVDLGSSMTPSDAGSSSLMGMPSVPETNPFMMQQPQPYGMQQPLGWQPTFTASQVAGPPPSSIYFPAAASGEDDNDELLGPENGI